MRNKLLSIFILTRSSINIADSIYVVVIMWAIQSSIGNTSFTSFSYAASSIATFFIIFIGPYIDRNSPIKVISFTLIIQIFNLFIFIYILNNDINSLIFPILLILVFISSFCSSIFYPANNTFFTKLFSKDMYKKGNTIFQTLDQVINLLCFLLIGILISYIGSINTLYISIGLFIIGLILTFMLNIYTKKDDIHKNCTNEVSYLLSLKKGFKIIKDIKYLRLTLPVSLYSNLAIGGFIALLPSISEEKGPIYYSFIYTVFFLGFIIGAILTKWLNTSITIIYRLSFLCGVMLLLFSLTLNSYYSFVFILFFGSCSALINIFDETIYQEYTPINQMGTVLTMKRAILSLSSPLGAILVGISSYFFSITLILLILSISKMIFDLFMYFGNKKIILRS